MKKNYYFILLPLIITLIILIMLYFVDIPNPSKFVVEDFKLKLK